MKYEDIRRQVLTAIRQASAQGLIHGTSGNISVRDREAGVAAITHHPVFPVSAKCTVHGIFPGRVPCYQL
mgnify:CR=1 FL=1